MKKVSLLILVSMILLLAFTSCDVLPETVTGPLNNVKDTVVTTFNNVKNTVVGTFNNVKDKVEIAIGTHEHEWNDATCTSPKTCRCGATEGEALGHDYSDATCYEPQTCKNCGETLGIELVHNWVSATCTEPKTCLRCGLTEGEALGHDWMEATCTKPSTCSRCEETSGEPKGHTIVGATCTEAQHCTVCGAVGQPALGHDYSGATCVNPESKCTRCGAIEENPEIKHKVTHYEAVEPSCHQNGNVEYWVCEDCECVWTDEALTAVSNRLSVIVSYDVDNVVHVDKVEASCHQNGSEEYWYCVECDAVFADAALTQLTNRLNLTISYNAENVVHVDKVEPSCHQNGSEEYWYCVECEAVFADAALRQLTNRLNLTISYNAENIVHVDKVEAACHQNGTEEYWYCAECDAVFADAALRQLTNRLNLTISYNAENIIYVEAKDANCTDTNGHYEYWYCAECDAVFADAALRQLTNRLNLTIPYGHTWVDATCDAPKTCTRCGETEGEALASHTIKVIPEEGKYYCATCDAYYVVDNKVVFTGSENFVYNVNGAMPNQKVDGAYSAIFTPDVDTAPEVAGQGWAYNSINGKLGAQPMYWIPSNGNGAGLKDFTCANGATGVISFTMKTSMTDPFAVAVAKERSASDWSGWGTSEINLFSISGAAGAETVVLTNVFTSSFDIASIPVVDGWAEFSVELFISLSEDNTMTLAYYVNGQFCNAISGAITTMDTYDIRALYINGWTYTPGTGIILDDIVFGSTTTSEWIFNEHVHTWADADCENAKHCTICGLTEGDPLGHTPGAEATCTTNQICTVCEKELVKALGHDWADAQCDAPSTCNRCGEESGDVLGHDFKDEAYVYNNDAKCEVDGTETAKCSRCDATDTRTVEGSALAHEWSVATCTTPATCSKCNSTKGEADADNHVALVRKLVDKVIVYSCDCGYTFTVKVGDYSDGTNYNGISANAPDNSTYYTNNPDKAYYPVLSEGGYLEFVRKTDAEGVANTKTAQLQLWLPTTGGANKYAGFTSANSAVGYLSFKINAYTDKNLEMKLVDNTTDYIDVNGDGVVDQATERIRWGDLWAINDPVFRVSPVSGGKTELKGFNGVVLTTVDVDENNYTGWVDVAIQLTLDPVSDTVIAKYFINGKYATTSSRPLTIHSNGINCVYLNSNNTAAGTGYKIDDLAFGCTAHEHDFSYVEENGTLVYTCPCGAEYSLLSEYREWNGDGNDDHFDHGPNGKVDTVYNEDGTWGFIFNPVADSDWASYGDQKGGQIQPWIPSSTRNEHTLSGFSCENNAVGVIAFTMKTNMTRHADRDTNVTLGVGKPRNAGDWNDGGSWTDDQIQILCIEDYLETGVVIKGGVNSNMTLATIPVADGWSEWFDVMISIEMLDTGYMNTYYYINGVYCGMYSRDLSKADADGRYLNPKKIEAFQFSGWTFAANTGILFDDLVFGYTAGGHNTLDGQIHNLTETTCGEKSVCSCGWTGYTLDHDLTEATCGAPATCKVCGLTEGEALTHKKLSASTADGVTTYACSDCGKQYVADSHNLYYDGSAQVGTWGVNGDVTSTVVDGYNAVINKETDGTYYNANGNQFMTWIPSQSTPAEFDGFTCANNAIGLASFKIKAYTDSVTGVEFKINDGRGTDAWNNAPSGNAWADCSVGIFTIKPVTSADATTAEIRGLNGNALTTVPLAEGSKWTEWLDVALLIKLSDDNKISVDYYINSAFVGNITMNMPIYTGKISSFYINGYTKSDDTGYYLDDLAFGYTLNGLQTPEEPIYTEFIAAENVTSEALKTIVAGKIKQFDQTNPAPEGDHTYGYFVKEVGTPAYVLANKDGAQVEAVYLSRSVDWDTYASVSTQNGFKSEFRFAIDNTKRVTSISFDYLLNGTLTGNRSSGNANGQLSIFQIKYTNKADNTYNPNDQYFDVITDRVDNDDTFIITDGEWHTFSYEFENSVQLDNFLVILSEFQGEILLTNLVIEYAE